MRFFPLNFVRVAIAAAFVAGAPLSFAAGSSAKKLTGPELGLQTWTCRNMNFDEVIAFAKKHGITHVQFIDRHFDPFAPKEETLRKKAILDQNGIVPYTFGVAKTSLDKEQNRKLFEFAKLIGAKLIIVEPRDQAIWDGLEQLVKEYDIKLAIHNHGRGTVYGDPETVKAILAKRDKRIGVCLDVGHVVGAGYDAARVFRDYGADRVFDIHFKDKTVQKDAKGKDAPVDTEIGKGDAKYPAFFAELKKSKWAGVMAIETDSKAFAEDPNRLVAEARQFFAAQVGKK